MAGEHRTDSAKAVVVRNPLLPHADAARSPADPDDLTGNVLADRYRLLRILGRGGMGYVFVAEHTKTGGAFAIKVLSTKFASVAEHRSRFLREAKATSKVRHDNVVTVTDFGPTPNGSVFMAMELLDGETVADLVDREAPLPWPRVKLIALQLCRALRAAHEHGVLHRDIKPDNCIRIRRGANRDFIKILDFGLAKIAGNELDPEQSLTERGTIFGTPEYMSPEQARGQAVDARSDVYALGIVLYEMLTGHVPFTGGHFMEILSQQTVADPPRPTELAPLASIPATAEELVLRAIEKDPANRFQDMRQLAEAIAAIPSSVATTKTVSASASPARDPLLVRLVWLLAILCLLLAVSVVMLVLR